MDMSITLLIPGIPRIGRLRWYSALQIPSFVHHCRPLLQGQSDLLDGVLLLLTCHNPNPTFVSHSILTIMYGHRYEIT